MEYYHGLVQLILDSVSVNMYHHRQHKFVWSETSYLRTWFEDDRVKAENKQHFRDALARGQIEIVNGGWVMHDEATTHYLSQVEQMTEGHEWLLKEFGVKPRFAWQIDPFGYTMTSPTMFAKMGFEAVVHNRIYHVLKQEWREKQHLEYIHQGTMMMIDQYVTECVLKGRVIYRLILRSCLFICWIVTTHRLRVSCGSLTVVFPSRHPTWLRGVMSWRRS